MSARIILIGGFNETKFLAKSLISKGYAVTAINEYMDQCDILAEIDGLKVFHGDGSKPYVLEDADIYGADIAIAMTEFEDANLVICQLCKKKFKVGKTVALINNPQNTDFFMHMGVDNVVCSISILSDIIEQNATYNEIKTIMPIGTGKVQVEQIQITIKSPIANKQLMDVDLPEGLIVGCVMRGEETFVPNGSTRIYPGDNIIVIISAKDRNAVIRKIVGR